MSNKLNFSLLFFFKKTKKKQQKHMSVLHCNDESTPSFLSLMTVVI